MRKYINPFCQSFLGNTKTYKDVEQTSLYENISGTSSTIVLSDTCEGYDFIEIYYFYDNDTQICSKTFSPNNKLLPLFENTYFYNHSDEHEIVITRTARVLISNNIISFQPDFSGDFMIQKDHGIAKFNNDLVLKISKIVGYKYS